MTPPPFAALLFDLDGTLLDTAPDLGAAVNHVLTREGMPALPESIVRRIASDGALGLLKAGFGEAELARRDSQALRQALLDYYAEHLYEGTRPYPGMVEFIAWLNTQGIRWGIVTNKPAFLPEPLMAQVRELPQCGVIVSADTLPERKPHPAPMLYAAAQLAVAPEACLYIGDHIRDIEAGRAASMKTAIAAWGYIDPAEGTHAWGADWSFDTVDALHHWLCHLPR
ncbi:MAG: HAD-IA family hydrolase [Aeromonadaceae bacterium]